MAKKKICEMTVFNYGFPNTTGYGYKLSENDNIHQLSLYLKHESKGGPDLFDIQLIAYDSDFTITSSGAYSSFPPMSDAKPIRGGFLILKYDLNWIGFQNKSDVKASQMIYDIRPKKSGKWKKTTIIVNAM